MALFSPYALQAGFEGQDLATQLRVKQLQEQAARQRMDDEQKARQARALIGQVLQQAGVGTPNAIPQSPAPGQSSVPMQRPGAVQRAPMPNAGAPQPNAMPEEAPAGGMPEQPDAMPSAPAQAPAQPSPQRMPLSWQNVAEEVRKRTDAPPEVIFAAMQEIMPQLEKESDRTAKSDAQKAALAQKQQALADTLRWRFAQTDSGVEKAQIMADMRRLTTQMQNDSRENIAGMNNASREGIAAAGNTSKEGIAAGNNASRENVAGMNNGRALYVAELNNNTKQDIADRANDLKQELGSRKLDINQLQVDNLMVTKQRALDLQEQGMNKKDAQFYAKLDVTKQLADMRDATSRRGQDMVSADKQAAINGKIDLARGKAANATDASLQRIDDFITSAHSVLDHPGLDQASGSVAGALPSVRQDSVNFDAALDSLRSEKGLAVIQALKDASASGGSGFSRVTNFELQQLQNSMGSLKQRQSPEALRENLLKVIDAMSRSKMRIAQGYERTYGKAAGTGGAGVPVAQPGAGKGVPTPAAVTNEPDGTVFEMGGKRYSKQGSQSVPVQ